MPVYTLFGDKQEAVAHGMVSFELNHQLPEVSAAEELYADALALASAPFLPNLA